MLRIHTSILKGGGEKQILFEWFYTIPPFTPQPPQPPQPPTLDKYLNSYVIYS